MNTVKIVRMYDDVILPKYATDGAVGMDICAYIDEEHSIWIHPNEIKIVPTGIKLELPDNIECQVRSRSGLSTIGVMVVNSPGTIDPDYRGEIKIILTNLGKEPFIINKFDRIAQLVFAPIIRVKLEEATYLNQTERGSGGFGSTGINLEC
jgi:dUTP pyrophosphatase